MSYYIQKYPNLLLIGPVKRKKSRGALKDPHQLISKPAESMNDVAAVHNEVKMNLCTIIQFLAALLLNSLNKSIFNSVEELVDLLAAADDTIATVALEALCNLASVPLLHKQQAPEVQQHSTALHNSKTTSHKRLIALARGWGTRGAGLGLYTCSTADNSEFGQGALPKEAGELNFAFFSSPMSEATDNQSEYDNNDEIREVDESYMVRISLHAKEIIDDTGMSSDPMKVIESTEESGKQKRRRVAPITLGEKSIRSSSELFFLCLEKAGGRSKIPEDRLFALLADIRLTRSFYCQATRVAAVERRLLALITILNAHPSQEIMTGYFQAQPELCVELIDLLRPTVSSAAVSSAFSGSNQFERSSLHQDAIAALANSSAVPYGVRKLALESLTALVARRDGTSGALTGVARHSNVLSELGVGKGQYLGLLPTLIRFSLSSFVAFLSNEKSIEGTESSEKGPADALSFEIGLAFVEAAAAPQIQRDVQLEKALEFIESVLIITATVVSTPSGTSALTECGLIPALLTVVAIDTEKLVARAVSISSSSTQARRIESLLRFITAQAIQILEGAIVTHNNALSAFHGLQGVEVLTTRLSREILTSRTVHDFKSNKKSDSERMDLDHLDSGKMEVDALVADEENDKGTKLQASQRVLLFSIVTCLTVVFHQESTSSSVTAPSGAAELRKPELTKALIEIMENIEAYGGHLASLIATLLSDVMNSDPHVVKHVHDSGLAESFLSMLNDERDGEPILPAVPELVMAIPNVLSALALTEHGAKAVKDVNPFPKMLRLFYHPKYAMPKSRCLLNEMTAIVGTGLDEIMRHVNSLRPIICESIAEGMNKVAQFGEELCRKEEGYEGTTPTTNMQASELENERSCLIQYALNFGQILEQILHNEDHCDPFVAAGGLDALLKLYPYMTLTGTEFLSHISSLSCPSVSTLTHSTSEDSIVLAFKCIALRYDSFKMLQTMINALNSELKKLEEYQLALRETYPKHLHKGADNLDATCILEGLPREALYEISGVESKPWVNKLSRYLRQVVFVQHMTGLLSTVIKAACQRSQETGTGWSRAEREWKKELSSTAFEELVERITSFFQSAILEVCRIRTEPGFEERERQRLAGCKPKKLRYRLRIVCPEGAVVRDGIEIDSCASVGSMEMGEIVVAFDRCVNSSGVLRYKTRRGWVSEQTRGHGREPIAEVLHVWEAAMDDEESQSSEEGSKGRIEAGVPDICSTSVNILARVQASYSDLFSALSRVVMNGIRSLPIRTLSFQQGTVGAHVETMMRILSLGVLKGFNRKEVSLVLKNSNVPESRMNKPGIAMYLGCLLGHLYSFMFEEKRDRRMVNTPLLLVVTNASQDSYVTVFEALHFIFKQSLIEFKLRGLIYQGGDDKSSAPSQRISRITAACLPPAITMLKRLLSISSITSSPVSSQLSRLKCNDLEKLLGRNDHILINRPSNVDKDTYSPERFTRSLLCSVSETVMEIWLDPKYAHSPPYITYPITSLVVEIMSALELAAKKEKTPSTPPQNPRENSRLWNSFRGLVASARDGSGGSSNAEVSTFEASEELIQRLMEMGFSRDHAWDAIDSSRSNRLEVAMEYALSHPPSSPTTIARRRAASEARQQRQRQQQQDTEASQEGEEGESSGGEVAEARTREADNADSSDSMDLDAAQESEKGEKAQERDETVMKAVSYLASWKVEASRVVCDILSGKQEEGDSQNDLVEGDGEAEASTVVLSSFLLDLCQRYPDERDRIATELFFKLKDQIEKDETSDSKGYRVKSGKEKGFALLCHGAVLFTRALPKTRKLFLKQSLINPIVSCFDTFLLTLSEKGDSRQQWPVWLAPSLLLIDIMAQPFVAFPSPGAEDDDGEKEIFVEEGELAQLKKEHKKQSESLSSLAKEIFAALYAEKTSGAPDESQGKGIESKVDTSSKPSSLADDEVNKQDQGKASEVASLFQSVPAYFPLLPAESFETCANICLRLISGQRGKYAPPGVIHSALLLLMRLLRMPKISNHCLKNGAAEKVLSLPKECRFTGHSGLVTLILRRLLEDEATLQTAMETEIRGTILKLHKGKDGNNSRDTDTPSVPRHAFVQAITPLLCRDPASFLKAVSVSVYFEKTESDQSSKSAKVTLLSSADRQKNLKVISELLKSGRTPSHPPRHVSRRSSNSGRQRRSSNPGTRSKTPNRSNKRGTPKKTKKEKVEIKEKPEEDAQITTHISPASHVISLLMNRIILQSAHISNTSTKKAIFSSGDFGFDDSFLWTANMLEILADLVLAIPACATAIHKLRPPRTKERHDRNSLLSHLNHALSGCPNPSKTFVSYLFHHLLSQDRWSSQKDQQFWNRDSLDATSDSALKTKKKAAFRRTKVAQSTARLLIALVARPGEGRKRVITELAFALSGGKVGPSSSIGASNVHNNKVQPHADELHALQAWGELCIGLAAPRSNGNNYDGSYDGVSTLSFEVVKIMLESGMAHALLIAMHRVPLHHPMSSKTLGSLILPLEILTRPEVADAVKILVENQSIVKETKGLKQALKELKSSVEENRRDSFADDHMLEDAFGMDVARGRNLGNAIDAARNHLESDEDNGDNDEEDVNNMEIDDDIDDEGDSEDEEMSSSDESEESSDIGDSSDDEDDEDDDQNDNEDDHDESSILEESEGTQSIDEFEQDFISNGDFREDALVGDNDHFDGDDGGVDHGDSGLEEGWTRIESSGFGGMVLGSRRGMSQPAFGGNINSRARGFIDAAEAMIGTLLRTGEIRGDALAEIEGSLGIRIHTNMPTGIGSPNRGDLSLENMFGSRQGATGGNMSGVRSNREIMGTLPHIHQRSQPDVGYSALSGGRRWNEISSMEFVYGGPSVSAGSRNYDLVSPMITTDDDQEIPTISQLDGRLFPGGPASATHARTQHSTHPLLCGVDLPPINSLVSDLLPHGVRATRRGQMTTRRPGDWSNASFGGGGFLVSTSNGNIIRSNRPSTASPRGGSGLVGWTDDGLPFDATIDHFSAAFDRALGESMTTSLRLASQQNTDERETNNQVGDDGAADDNNSAMEGSAPSNTLEISSREIASEQETNDGDRVASSLAAHLRLSSGSDTNEGEGVPNNDDQPTAGSDTPMEDTSSSTGERESQEGTTENQPDASSAEAVRNESERIDGEQNSELHESPNEGNDESESQLVCPPGMDPEVFAVLPMEMQREVVEQARTEADLAAQLDEGSSLDPEVLAALPEDMRREAIEQEQRERRLREAPADPANAEDMDSASFIASLAPELRADILLTADDALLQSLPPNIRAEAQILRERASSTRRPFEQAMDNQVRQSTNSNNNARDNTQGTSTQDQNESGAGSSRRRQRGGKIRVEIDREDVVYLPPGGLNYLTTPVSIADLKGFLRLMYLLSPVRPHRLVQKVFQNFCTTHNLRHILSSTFIKLLHDDNKGAVFALEKLQTVYSSTEDWRSIVDLQFCKNFKDFPPQYLIGAAPEVLDTDGLNPSITMLRRKQTSDTAASIAANLPLSSRGSRHEQYLPPVVATRIVDTLQQICKASPKFCMDLLTEGIIDGVPSGGDVTLNPNPNTGFDRLLDLLERPRYAKSSANLEQLLSLLELAVTPLSHLSKDGEEDGELSKQEIEAAISAGKEWVDVPRIVVSQERLQNLCSILRMETCRDTAFNKVNTIARRLCRIDANRGYVLAELASVAKALGADAIRDLKALSIRMSTAALQMEKQSTQSADKGKDSADAENRLPGSASNTIAVSTSTSELKLLRVLQTLQHLCVDTSEESSLKKNEGGVFVTEELVHLLRAMNLDDLWSELTACLKIVQVLEGVTIEEDADKKADEAETNEGEEENEGKKLQNSVAGLLTRFLPSIEAFFVANASSISSTEKDAGGSTNASTDESTLNNLVGGGNLVKFVTSNKVLLNALVRNNSSLLEKGLKALITVPSCRLLLDFDVKRQWFKTQLRRLRQQASRRHGSLRLHIRRKHVFEDAYHQLRLRNADEMRGRLHITFRNEDGVDAGGLSREFFGILAKEMFNPNYALFTSTEDGSTFQPNQNSSINPDHLSYFRFVGRIVGKAVSDGYLLDAHFTRSLYKHMLGIKVSFSTGYTSYNCTLSQIRSSVLSAADT